MGLQADVLGHLQQGLWPLRLMGFCPVHFPSLRFLSWRIWPTLVVSVSSLLFCFVCVEETCVSTFSYLPSFYRLPECLALQVFILSFIFRRSSLKSLLEDFIVLESKMIRFGVIFTYTLPPIGHPLIASFLLLVSILFGCFGSGVFTGPLNTPSVIDLFREYAFVLSLIAVSYGLTTFMYCPLNLMNATIAHFRLTIEQTKIKNNQSVVDLAVLHENICYLCENLNSFLSFQILFHLAACFLTLLANAYHACKSFNEISLLIKCFALGILMIVNFDALTNVSAKLTEMADIFNNELYRWVLDDVSGELPNDKKLLLHISKKTEIKFTAHGFFTLNYSIITSVFGALTTYLVSIL